MWIKKLFIRRIQGIFSDTFYDFKLQRMRTCVRKKSLKKVVSYSIIIRNRTLVGRWNMLEKIIELTNEYIESMPKKERKKYGQFFTSMENCPVYGRII